MHIELNLDGPAHGLDQIRIDGGPDLSSLITDIHLDAPVGKVPCLKLDIVVSSLRVAIDGRVEINNVVVPAHLARLVYDRLRQRFESSDPQAPPVPD